MNQDIHPHWKSTDETASAPKSADDANFWPDGEETPTASKPKEDHHRIRIAGGGASSLLLGLSFSTFGAVLLGLGFYQGVTLIRADLLEGRTPDVQVEVRDAEFSPQAFSIAAGKIVEWKNVGSGNQQFRSDQLDTTSSPFVGSPLLPPGERYVTEIPLALAGTMLTIRSEFIPTMTQTVTVEASAEAPTEEVETTSSLPPLPPSQPSLEAGAEPSRSELRPASVPSVSSVPSQPPTLSTPPSPSQPSTPSTPPVAPTPTIQIGSSETLAQSAWPNLLRVNRFTVGNVTVPDFSPISPIHAVREAQEEWERQHSAAPIARKQPETGPALWILSALTLGTMPFFFRGQKKQRS